MLNLILDDFEIREAVRSYVKKEYGLNIKCVDLNFYIVQEDKRIGARIGERRKERRINEED